MRLCIRLIDDRIIESQSGSGSLESLLQNALLAGYTKEEIEVLECEESEGIEMMMSQGEGDRTYVDKRKDEYPSIGDQLDAILKHFSAQKEGLSPDLLSLVTNWEGIKSKYPKPQ